MLYYYAAKTQEGRAVRGSLEAQTASSALASLRARALVVIDVHPAIGARGMLASLLSALPVSQTATVAFYRSLAVLVSSGVPIRRSLEVTIEQCPDPRLREALRGVASDIESGLGLSDALARRPREFSRAFVIMIRAGEIGGALDDVLERIATLLERDRAMRKRIGAALAYPAVVSCAALGLVLFLLTSIVPMFSTMFAQMHVPLPPVTAALIRFASLLRQPGAWASALLAAASAAAFIRGAGTTKWGAFATEAILYRIPLLGPIRQKSAVARLARMLGTLLRSGVSLVPAIEVAGDVVAGTPFESVLRDWSLCLAQGSRVAAPLAESALFDALFVQMLRVGEETGALDSMLLRIAQYYDVDVDAALSTLGALLEPAMILLLGGAVGFIVSAIFIPLYTLIGNIK